MLRINDEAPNFNAETSQGTINFHEWIGNAWAMVATPVNWKQGDDVIILPAVSDEESKQKFPGGWKAPRPALRIVPQPKERPQAEGHRDL